MHPEELAARNRRRSALYVTGAAVAVAAGAYVVGTLLAGGGWLVGVGAVAVATGLVGASYWESDRIVIASAGARPADPHTHRRLHNVVESVAIAAGVPKPAVYVVPAAAPNAFATGRDPDHAAVAVTTGLLDALDRAELEAVVAHEVAHVRNYDIRLMTVVAVLAGAIVLIADWSFRSLRWGGLSGDRRRSDGVLPVLVVIGVLGAVLAPIGARLITAAVSRQREYLADTSGVHLTHNPRALADALAKIAGDPRRVRNATHATAHLWIHSPLRPGSGDRSEPSWFDGLFQTHPPIADRIARLELLGA